jgi:hypothetical protein
LNLIHMQVFGERYKQMEIANATSIHTSIGPLLISQKTAA